MLTRMWRKRNPCTLLWECKIGRAIMENRIEILQDIKNKATM